MMRPRPDYQFVPDPWAWTDCLGLVVTIMFTLTVFCYNAIP